MLRIKKGIHKTEKNDEYKEKQREMIEKGGRKNQKWVKLFHFYIKKKTEQNNKEIVVKERFCGFFFLLLRILQESVSLVSFHSIQFSYFPLAICRVLI